MKNKRPLSNLFVLICLYCTGCAPLKEVNLFASASQQSLAKANNTGYGYYEFCYDSSYTYNKTGKFLVDFDCDCNYGHSLDTLIRIEYAILSNYFAALAKLSGSGSGIDLAPVAGAVSEGAYGSITITAQESKAVNTIATVASNLLNKNYKSKKVKEIILKYNDTLKMALELLKLHLDNLRSKIQLMQTELKMRSDLMMARAQTEAEKWAVVYVYKQRSRELARVIPGYDRRYQSLDRIQKGHMDLFTNAGNLRSESLKTTVLDLARDIFYLSDNSKN
jgi:hypothetical protein